MSFLEGYTSFIVIGIDPGSRITGYAVLKASGVEFSFLRSGVLSFKRDESLSEKLFFVYSFFYDLYDSLIASFSCPVVFSIEGQFSSINQRSSFILVSFSSIFLLLAEIKKSFCFEFSPTEVKKIVSGCGNATKEALFSSLQLLFDLSAIATFDESDAMAISLAGALRLRNSF